MRLRSSRLLSWLVAIVLVAIAAAGLKLSDSDSDDQILTATLGQPLRVNDGVLTATQVRVGTALKQFGEIRARTSGMFVAVTVQAEGTKTDRVSFSKAALLSGDRTYDEFDGSGAAADAGYRVTRDLVFEVDPARIDDLILRLDSGAIITGYDQQAQIYLGITAANAQGWSAAGKDQVLQTGSDVTEALP